VKLMQENTVKLLNNPATGRLALTSRLAISKPYFPRRENYGSRRPERGRTANAMIQRRAAAAGIKTRIGNQTFGATGITAYLNGRRWKISI
jgi:hypothetical protein